MRNAFGSLILFFMALSQVCAYRPVIMMHGIEGSHHDWDDIVKWIAQDHPGTPTYALKLDEDGISNENLMLQLKSLTNTIEKIIQSNNYTEVIYMCHSQGALLCRTALQTMDDHRGVTFISLSGPQLGQYGIPECPHVLCNIPDDLAHIIFYNSVAQDALSVANYWYDPKQVDEYVRESKFLAVYNNQSVNTSLYNIKYKTNFIKLNKLVLLGSPNDRVIKPWQSAFFAQYDENLKVVAMQNQEVYVKDSFGLATLDKQKKIQSTVVDDVYHTDWLYKYPLFQKYIEPNLD